MFGGVDGIGEQVGQHLHHRIRVNQRVRQRGIEFVTNLHHLPGGGLGRAAGAVDQTVDIDCPGLGRLVGRQGLHPVEQIDHPLDLGGDHLGQRFLRFVQLPVEQLSGAADRGQRVLDLVAEDVGRADRQIGRVAVLAFENRTVLRHRRQRDQAPVGIG